jgi:hypothetical protein
MSRAQCSVIEGTPADRKRKSRLLVGVLGFQPIFFFQRNDNAPGRLGNIRLAARPGGAQEHFRATIPDRPRLPELLQIRN